MLFFGMVIQNEEDRNIIKNLYHNYHRLMAYVAGGILKDQEEVEDAVSQAFIKIIDNLQKFSFEDCNKTKGLIGVLMKSVCYDMLRSGDRWGLVSLDEADSRGNLEDFPYEKLASGEGYQTILSGISGLSEKSGNVLKLRYIYDYSDRGIAELLNVSQGNVRVRLHRTKTALLQKLTEGGVGHK